MPSEGTGQGAAAREAAADPVAIAHSDGTLTWNGSSIDIDVARGAGFRGLISVPRERCRLRVMGRAVAVYDEERLVHLCSRCKPTTEVAHLVAELGRRAEVEQRTPFATLLALRSASAAYRPEVAPETVVEADAGAEPAVPQGYESLRRVYHSQAALDRDSRRLRAAGWTAHQSVLPGVTPVAAAPVHERGRWRRLVRAANPDREVTAGAVLWIRPLAGDEGEASV